MYQTLVIEQADGVAILWMDRPELHNAFNAELVAELHDACQRLAADGGLRVLVLAGRGRSFSAGADLAWMKAAGEAPIEDNLDDARRLAEMLRGLAAMRVPTIARVHGAAIGGGMGLATACDICIASETAVFATSEVRLGLTPATISPYVIRAIGERQARRYFLTGERISAAHAHEIGLVHELSAADDIDAAVARTVDALLLGGPIAQAAAKRLIASVAHRALDDELLEHTARCIAELRTTAEAREGLAAFRDKRPPGWTLPSESA